MKNYTKIPNEIFEKSQLSISARYLYCLLLKFCGKKEWCYPSQKTLGKVAGKSEKRIRAYLEELKEAGLILVRRTGFNKPNTYKVSKSPEIVEDRTKMTPQIGSKFPLHMGQKVPPKSTYIKEKDKTTSKKGMEQIGEVLKRKGIKK